MLVEYWLKHQEETNTESGDGNTPVDSQPTKEGEPNEQDEDESNLEPNPDGKQTMENGEDEDEDGQDSSPDNNSDKDGDGGYPNTDESDEQLDGDTSNGGSAQVPTNPLAPTRYRHTTQSGGRNTHYRQTYGNFLKLTLNKVSKT